MNRLRTLSVPRICFIIAAAALVIRVVYLLWTPDPPELRYFNFDEADYELIAKNLYEGNGYCYIKGQPTAFRPPLYPLLVASIYRTVGQRSHSAVRWVQVFLSAFTAGLFFLIGHLVFGRKAGMWAGILFAIYPTMLYYVPKLLTETFFIFLLSASLATIVLAIKRNMPRLFAVAGLVVGLAFLCRPVLLPFMVLLFWPMVLALAKRGILRRAGLCILAFYAAFAVVTSGWVARNYAVFGEFIPTDTHLGWVAWHNTKVHFDFDADFDKAEQEINALAASGKLTSESLFDAIQAHGHFGAQAQKDGIQKAYGRAHVPQTETEISRFFMRKAAEFYAENKLLFVRDRIANFVNFWMPISSIEGRKGEYLYAYGVIAMLAAVGFYFVIRRKKVLSSLPLILIAANFWIATTLVIYHSRLKMPADVATILLAGFAIDTINTEKGKVRLLLVVLGAIAINLILGLFLLPLKELVKSVF